MFFPFLVILPGMIALALTAPSPGQRRRHHSPPAPHRRRAAGRHPAKLDATGQPMLDANGKPLLDYDLAIPIMLLRYFPTGMLGLGLTALMASFMSGMAGNVTAFNTVWTYDIYQSLHPHATPTDAHYLWMGRVATVVRHRRSRSAAAYLRRAFNNIMDLLQLVFAFVNAPLFATFLLGMFWKRATGHGAFCGLLSGTLAAALHHGLTLPAGAVAGVKGGWLARRCTPIPARWRRTSGPRSSP